MSAVLIKNIPSDKMHFLKHVTKDENQINVMKQKGQFPYDWFDSLEKLKMPISKLKRELLDQNQLTLFVLSNYEWNEVENVIKQLNFQTFEEYHNYYLNIDVQ